MSTCAVIIPALNEEESIGKVLKAIPSQFSNTVVVVDNGSHDKTAEVARSHGAVVLSEPQRGYGYACVRGIRHLGERDSDVPPIVVFLDGDYSDYPEEMEAVVAPILRDNVDLVIGSRALGNRESGSMTIPQRFGNWLSTRLIRVIWGAQFTDLGPFRAITWRSLMAMDLKEMTYGWTVEMQIKAAKLNLSIEEVPVNYRRRIGFSKVSGTVSGTVKAGVRILWTIFKNI